MQSKPDLIQYRSETLGFARSVARGLGGSPRRLECRYIYDDRGSRLFESICDQPEYYLTRTEESILRETAGDIADATGPVSIIEFGSGNSMKTRILLDAYVRKFSSVKYVPVDINRTVLEEAGADLARKQPGVHFEAFHGCYEEAFHLFSDHSPSLFLFLGSNVGNMDDKTASAFWSKLSGSLNPGDYCLLGVDINEDPDTLNAAYNDRAGFTADFTKNIFHRINRELGAAIDVDEIEHAAEYRHDARQVEIFARFNTEQHVHIAPLGHSIHIGKGEKILVEISRKFRLDQLSPQLARFGLKTLNIFGRDRRFAVLLLRKAGLNRGTGGQKHDKRRR